MGSSRLRATWGQEKDIYGDARALSILLGTVLHRQGEARVWGEGRDSCRKEGAEKMGARAWVSALGRGWALQEGRSRVLRDTCRGVDGRCEHGRYLCDASQ